MKPSLAASRGLKLTVGALAAFLVGGVGAVVAHQVIQRDVVFAVRPGDSAPWPNRITLQAGTYHLSSHVTGCDGISATLVPTVTATGGGGESQELWWSTPTPHEIDFTVTKTQAFRLDSRMLSSVPPREPCTMDVTITRN